METGEVETLAGKILYKRGRTIRPDFDGYIEDEMIVEYIFDGGSGWESDCK